MLVCGALRVDLDGHRVLHPDREEPLTQLEVDVLRYLGERRGAVVPRVRLERDVWRFASGVRSEAVPVAMRRLQRKLGDGVVTTVRGEGWRLEGAPPPKTAPVPTFATPFVGREALVAEIGRRFQGGWRVVTLRGPGGVGKTRVGVEVASRWPTPAVAVSLLGLPEGPEALGVLIADALGLGDASPGALRRGLGARERPLLLLDDADAVTERVAEPLGALVRDVPGLTVLVTSRVALGLAEEAVLEVAPFPRELARAFFVERLRAVHPDPEAEGSALDELVALLDGLPAALELYAGRGVLGLASLAHELRDGRQDGTLDDRVRRSWDGLDAARREVLLACSAFVGSFPPEAARAASGERLDVLADLRRCSLVQLDPHGQLFMLATVRRFCERQPGVRAARAPAWAWLLARAEAAAERLDHEPRRALEVLGSLRPHLLDLARTGPAAEAARAVLAAAAGLAQAGPTALRRALLEGVDPAALPPALLDRYWLELARVRRLTGTPVAEVDTLVAGIEGPEAAILRGDHALAAGDADAALAFYARAVEAAPEGHPTQALARIRRSASPALLVRRDPADVDADLAEAHASCVRHGFGLHQHEVERAAGAVALSRGDRRRGRTHLARALRLAEEAGLARHLGDTWNALGVAWYEDDLGQAEVCFRRAVGHALARGDEALAAVFHLNVSGAALLLDRPDEALHLLELPLQVLKNPVTRQLAGLQRAWALLSLGRDLEGTTDLDAIDPARVGAPFSPDPVAQGLCLVRMVAAERHLRALPSAPDVHGPALRAALAEVSVERGRTSATMLRALAERVERKLTAAR